jgi:hypothetical protein
MIIKILNRRYKTKIAKLLLVCFSIQFLTPLQAFALTSGPSQPESSSFEPVGTTDMVNIFSGDFNYNIPLLDIEGYPINIAYHSGQTTDDEASWVGLGWNINPGNVTRSIRGNPDDFDGDVIEKKVKINKEQSYNLGINDIVSCEILGSNAIEKLKKSKFVKKLLEKSKIKIPLSMDLGISYSNYNGLSASLHTGISPSFRYGSKLSVGTNLGITSTTNSGMDLDYSASVGTGGPIKILNCDLTGNFGQSLNSREGLKNTSFGMNAAIRTNEITKKTTSKNDKNEIVEKVTTYPSSSLYGTGSGNSFVPAGLQNFVPIVSNRTYSVGSTIGVKMGGEFSGFFPNADFSLAYNEVNIAENGSKKAFGYYNLQNANKEDITDFSRDRDGRFHKEMKYLPPASMSYDILSINGQGTGGSYRPFRNDIGTVFDPSLSSANANGSNQFDFGNGQIIQAGWDQTNVLNINKSQPWDEYYKKFSSKEDNSFFEPVYFKQAGEISEINKTYDQVIKGNQLVGTKNGELKKLMFDQNEISNPSGERSKRSNALYYFTNKEANNPLIGTMPNIVSYSGFDIANNNYSNIKMFDRIDNYRKANQIGEVTQLLSSGVRYNYALPAMNRTQSEIVSTVYTIPDGQGLVDMYVNSNTMPPVSSTSNGIGQSFHSVSKTPSFAHTFLLTSILSPNYSDLTGNGISDDDLGNFTKFNYSCKDQAYQWRAPYQADKGKFDKGVLSDCHDDKANAIVGTKEIWMLHSVESKNFIAEFHTSPRADGKGSNQTNLDANQLAGSSNRSFKLDKIVLYNKKDKFQNGANAVPVKSIYFSYDYELCKNAPNSEPGYGKLTLKAISIKYGNSDIGMLSPYRFQYSTVNPNYNSIEKDMWGSYKPSGSNSLSSLGINLSNLEYPYINQGDPNINSNASAWNLTKIFLPSGGQINVDYEADDYAYVQDRKAMQMFKVEGLGNSTDFDASGNLYQNLLSPNLYLYFKRNTNESTTDLKEFYLGGKNTIMYNFNVKISDDGTTTKSCNSTPLTEQFKGYAAVEDLQICTNNPTYAYIKLKPKYLENKGIVKTPITPNGFKLNPISIAAINYARYNNNKALYPESEILFSITALPDLVKQMFVSQLDMVDFLVNPLITLVAKNKGKVAEIDKSYIRLQSGGQKYGGGHRVKQIRFSDKWDQLTGNPAAEYGSTYEYKTIENGKSISSGVASYEPIGSSDENPFKELLNVDKSGNSNSFPPVDPIEIFQEGPIGETMYPSASVGYSKVTVKSIHKDKGESSQVVQENEFYTAKDFPVQVTNTEIDKVVDKPINKFDIRFKKKEEFRFGQGYTMVFNDMHGKPKQTSTKVDKDGSLELISFNKQNYFADVDNKKLSNDKIPCMKFTAPDGSTLIEPSIFETSLGEEKDFTIDTREKIDVSTTKGFMMNVNTFLIGGVPTPIPVPLPKITKGKTSIFSSVVATKIIQQYGILKSVETFDKGAKLLTENVAYDALTGQPLVTKVSTEHFDKEYQIKYPAYWAYKGMGPAYQNIQYTEVNEGAKIKDNILFFTPNQKKGFNIGDELLISVDKSCNDANLAGKEFKTWVVDIGNKNFNSSHCDCGINNQFECKDVNNQVFNSQPDAYFTNNSNNSVISYEGIFKDGLWTKETNWYIAQHEDCNLKYKWLKGIPDATNSGSLQIADLTNVTSLPSGLSDIMGNNINPNKQLPLERLKTKGGNPDMGPTTPYYVNVNALSDPATNTNASIFQPLYVPNFKLISSECINGFRCRFQGSSGVPCNNHGQYNEELFFAKKNSNFATDHDPNKTKIFDPGTKILRVKVHCELESELFYIHQINATQSKKIILAKPSAYDNQPASYYNSYKDFVMDYTVKPNDATYYKNNPNLINGTGNIKGATVPYSGGFIHPVLSTPKIDVPNIISSPILSNNSLSYFYGTSSKKWWNTFGTIGNRFKTNYNFPYIYVNKDYKTQYSANNITLDASGNLQSWTPASDPKPVKKPIVIPINLCSAIIDNKSEDYVYKDNNKWFNLQIGLQIYPKPNSITFPSGNGAPNSVVKTINDIYWPKATYSDFPDQIPDEWGNNIQRKWNWKYTTSFEIIDRPNAVLDDNSGTESLVVSKPIKKGALASDGVTKFPANAILDKISIKVIRSGKRNLLSETVQDASIKDDPFNSNGKLKDLFTQVLAIGAKTFTDKAYLPESVNALTDDYFNEVVMGAKASYKVKQEFTIHKLRQYVDHINKNEGTFEASSFWTFIDPAIADEMENRLKPTNNGSNGWYAKSFVNVYAPWGADLEVIDATGNKHSNLFGYNQSLPTAVVSNCSFNNALFENFEDANQKEIQFIYSPIAPCLYYQNIIKKVIIDAVAINTNTFEKVNTAHTGKFALKINANNSINVPLQIENNNTANLTINQFAPLTPFYFRKDPVLDKKYIVSCWQQVNLQNGTIPTSAALKYKSNNIITLLKPKSPNIDGWVLFEGVLNIPSTSNASVVEAIFTQGSTIDDIRILPFESNMKSYVYDNMNRRLLSVLDENHFATIFDYSTEGKLLHVKKETEKGILTLKESREALFAIINPNASSNTTYNLNNLTFFPPISPSQQNWNPYFNVSPMNYVPTPGTP